MEAGPQAHKHKAKDLQVRFALLVTSSTLYEASRISTTVEDKTGELAKYLIEKEGFLVLSKMLAPNSKEAIREMLEKLISEVKPDIIIVTGGTGISPRDVTVDVVESLIEKKMEGFGELMRLISYQEIGSAAMLTRSTAGIRGETAIFSLPGSPQAVEVALKKLILPEARHIVYQLKTR
ncbi:MAG: MogA/MoaB family molybdenum cofactor biosynthesis protein [Candidatus Nezhaarchaeales archaeon]